MADYQESIVADQLRRKHDLDLDPQRRIIRQLANTGKRNKGDVGIKSKGKISFLIRHCGWTMFYVDAFE